jgi:hypothetical protein
MEGNSEFKPESIKTEIRQDALAHLARCLESAEYVNAGIQKVGLVYSVRVARLTNECADDLDLDEEPKLIRLGSI